MLNCIRTQATASNAWEDNIRAVHARLIKPSLENRSNRLGERHGALFSTLPNDLQIGCLSECQVLSGQTRHFGQTQSSLNGQQHQGMVTPPRPYFLIGGTEESFN